MCYDVVMIRHHDVTILDGFSRRKYEYEEIIQKGDLPNGSFQPIKTVDNRNPKGIVGERKGVKSMLQDLNKTRKFEL